MYAAVVLIFLANVVLITADTMIDYGIEERDVTLTEHDFAVGEGLEERTWLSSDDDRDPLDNPGLFEGDIATPDGYPLRDFVEESNGGRSQLGRNGIRSRWKRWPNGEIPYVMSNRYSSQARAVLAKAMISLHKQTCIRFTPRTNEKDYIFIHPKEGCFSIVGKAGGRQPVSLDRRCLKTGIVIHELIHAIGFFHEQSRADRDDYVTIIWKNVDPNNVDQFEKYSLDSISHLGARYDYGSLMHYGPYSFSKDKRRLRTIVPRKRGAEKMGQRDGPSTLDIDKINRLYGCKVKVKPMQVKENKPEGSPNCTDKESWCKYWSANGYCHAYTKYMEDKCPRSCQFCLYAPQLPKCEDKRTNCKIWATKKFCSKYESYMKRQCQQSCGYCNN